jgi:hypothetical protein
MLRFVDRREIEAVEQLADVERRQLRAAGQLYDGEDLPVEARLDEGGDEGSFHGSCTVWRILDGDRHAFDAWLYLGDSGTIFRAGTTDKVAEIVQRGLECSDRRLRAELGPAMVAARLLPESDASFGEFAELLAKQQAGVVLSPILAEGTMPASPHALAASGLEEVSQAELAELVAAEIAPAPRRANKPKASSKRSAKPRSPKAKASKASAKPSKAKSSKAKSSKAKPSKAKPSKAKPSKPAKATKSKSAKKK